MHALDADRIRAAAGCDALDVRTVEQTPSTNEVLMQQPFDAAPAPPVLLATLHQTAGRGRRGRAWICEPGRSLAFSVAFERFVTVEPPPAGLSIVVGAAAAVALTPWAADLRLKWPNDLQRAGRKLGGILVETRRSLPSPGVGVRPAIERIVVGIGINLVAPRETQQFAQPACGLFEDGAICDDPAAPIGRVAGEVVRAVDRFLAQGLGPSIAAWRRFDALQGEPVVVLEGGRIVASGRALGIDENGALRLSGDRGIEVVRSGEVSVRRSDAGVIAGIVPR